MWLFCIVFVLRIYSSATFVTDDGWPDDLMNHFGAYHIRLDVSHMHFLPEMLDCFKTSEPKY